MHKILIQKAFERAEKIRRGKGDNQPSRVHLAEDLARFINEATDFSIGEMSLRTYYRNSLEIKDKNEDITISKLRVVEGLYVYLGYDSYKEFLLSIAPPWDRFKFFLRKNKYVILMCLTTVIATSAITFNNQQKWMAWDGLEYVRTSFSEELYERGELKLYNAEKIRNFKKIPNPDCNTEYYNEKGERVKWYYKNKENKLEIFTAAGVHPTNGATLRRISPKSCVWIELKFDLCKKNRDWSYP
jgi:hypothetical protein